MDFGESMWNHKLHGWDMQGFPEIRMVPGGAAIC